MPLRIAPDRKVATVPLSIHRAISAQPTRKKEDREEDIRQAQEVGAEQEERAQVGNRVLAALNQAAQSIRERQQAQARQRQEFQQRRQEEKSQGLNTLRQLASQFEPEQASPGYLQAASNRSEIPLTDIESEARKAEGVARLSRFSEQTRDLDSTQQGDLIMLSEELNREGLGPNEFQTAVTQAESGDLNLVPEETRGRAARVVDRFGTPQLFPQPIPTPPPPVAEVEPQPVPGPRLAIPTAPEVTPISEVREEVEVPTVTPTPPAPRPEPTPIAIPTPPPAGEPGGISPPVQTLGDLARVFAPREITQPDGTRRFATDEEAQELGGQVAREFFQLASDPAIAEQLRSIRVALSEEGVTPSRFVEAVNTIAERREEISIGGVGTALEGLEDVAGVFQRLTSGDRIESVRAHLARIEAGELALDLTPNQLESLKGQLQFEIDRDQERFREELLGDLVFFSTIPSAITLGILEVSEKLAEGNFREALVEGGIVGLAVGGHRLFTPAGRVLKALPKAVSRLRANQIADEVLGTPVRATRSNRAWEQGGRLIRSKTTGEVLGPAEKFTTRTVTVGGRRIPWSKAQKVVAPVTEDVLKVADEVIDETRQIHRLRAGEAVLDYRLTPEGAHIMDIQAPRRGREMLAALRSRVSGTITGDLNTTAGARFFAKQSGVRFFDRVGGRTISSDEAVRLATQRRGPVMELPAVARPVGEAVTEIPIAARATESATIKQNVAKRIRDAKRVRIEGEAERSVVRGQRAAAAREALSDTSLRPDQQLRRATGALKGKLPAIERFEALGTTADQEYLSLINEIDDYFRVRPGREFDWRNTREAWEELWTGGNPIPSARKLLEESLGDEIGAAIFQTRAKFSEQALSELLAFANIPRVLMATWDFSMPFRQAIVQTVSHPMISGRSTVRALRVLANPKVRAEVDVLLKTGPEALRANRAGLVGLKGLEQFENLQTKTRIGKFMRKIPGIKWSEEGAAYYLALLRRSVFDQTMAGLAKAGRTIPLSEERAVASYLNATTGWGSLGPLEKFRAPLGTIFFSARLQAARLQTPFFLFKKETRKIAARDLSRFFAFGLGVLGLADISGLADVEHNPLSPDAYKLKIGSTRLDFWGGFQPLVRYFAQITTGKAKTQLGEIVDRDIVETALRAIRSKLSPAAGLLTDIKAGETFLGEEMTTDPPDMIKQIRERLVPLFVQDIWDATNEQGPLGAALALPGFGGVSITSYTPLSIKVKSAIAEDYQQGYLRDAYESVPIRRNGLTPRDKLEFDRRHPDLANEASTDLANRAARGDSLARLLVEAKGRTDLKEERIRASAARLEANEIGPSQFRREIERTILLDRGGRAVVSALIEKFDLDEREGPLGVLNGYYEIFERFPEADTNTLQQEDLFTALEQYRSSLNPRDLEILESNLNVSLQDIPIYQEFLEDKRTIGASGWWDLPDQAWAMVITRLSQDLQSPAIPPDYNQYVRQLERRAREEVGELAAPVFIRNDPIMKLRSDILDGLRLRWRRANLDVMPLLQKWQYGNVPQGFIPGVQEALTPPTPTSPATVPLSQQLQELGVPIPGR